MSAPLLPVERLISVGVVVDDLDRATRRYAEIFGIDTWEVREFGPERLSDVVSHGRRTETSFRTATGTTVGAIREAGVAPGPSGIPVTFELVQPLSGESPFAEFRYRRRQGISHLTLVATSPAEFAQIREGLEAAGIPVSASMTVDGEVQRHFVDTRKVLGGYHVEILVADGASADALPTLAVDEVWDHSGSYQRPAGVGPLPVQGVGHFGIVVNDVVATADNYNKVLGVEQFRMRDWRTEPGLLDNPFYRGEQVEHEYYTGLGAFRDFAFEIIEPTFGPSHYNREFRDLYGEGIHHMLLSVTADEELWKRNWEWLSSIGVPPVMGSDLVGGSGEFVYFDTAPALGGWVLEATCRHFAAEPHLVQPHYVIDFAALTAVL